MSGPRGPEGPALIGRDRWRLLAPLIDAALELPPGEWPSYVERTCGSDESLASELRSLLRSHHRTDPLFSQPAGERFAALLAELGPPPPEIVSGNYRIERQLGRGGMATVYLAYDVRHDRRVAVKLVHASLIAAFRAEQFLSEIRTMARLRHPRILPLFDSGQSDGLLYYVMPYVPGETLRQRLQRDPPLTAEQAVRITQDVASAIDSAHRHGVIHRDIKPENILLDEDGAQVADFGIALAIRSAAAGEPRLPLLRAGTPRYASPEQMAAPDAVDGRSDIYSFGVVVREMLDRSESITSATRAVIDRATAERPGDRFSSAGEMADALARSLQRASPAATPHSRRQRWGAAGAGLVLLALITADVLVGRASPRFSTTGRAARGTPPAAAHQTHVLAAYDLYQRGLDQALSRSLEGSQQAIAYFAQAIAADPTYAAAHAELAHMYVVEALHASVGRDAMFARADSEARAAVALDDSLADAYAELGFVRMLAGYHLAAADSALQRAVALDSMSVRVHIYLAYLAGWREQPESGLAHARRASALDPLSVEASITLACALYAAGDYDEALVRLARLELVRPPVARIGHLEGMVYLSQGRVDESVRKFQAWDPGHPYSVRALAIAGRPDAARRLLATMLASERSEESNAYNIAVAYEALGDYDRAFQWLNRSIDERTLWSEIMWPAFRRLRADPRFDEIRRRLRTGS